MNGPRDNDTVSYEYDELGRTVRRTIAGVDTTYTFDALGRTSQEVGPFGTFTYAYDGVAQRLVSVSYPNGQESAFAYFGNDWDRRLQTMTYTRPGGQMLVGLEYAYDKAGNVTSRTQELGATPPESWGYGYDASDQLLTAAKAASGSSTNRFAYTYDAAGNRRTAQQNDAVTQWSYDNLHRLVQQRPGGMIRVAGTVSEPALVTINGIPTAPLPDLHFRGAAATAAGTMTLTVSAVDGSGNSTTQAYEVDQAGPVKAFTYDLNGNMTSDGERTFEWDAVNRLVSVVKGSLQVRLEYDGKSRLSTIREESSGVVTRERHLLWCGPSICAMKESGTYSYVEQNVFGTPSQPRFLARDHLNSIVGITDGSGNVVSTYEYDPFGVRTTLSGGTDGVPFGFTGHFTDQASELVLTLYRVYEPRFARWLSRDPLGLEASVNLYGYVNNRPLSRIDAYGLAQSQSPDPPPNCTGCSDDEKRQVREAKTKVCGNISTNTQCQSVMKNYGLTDCMQRKACKEPNLPVRCFQYQPDLRCGGPPLLDDVSYVGLWPNAFVGDWSKCGPVADTFAHELGHMCGIGHDAEVRNDETLNAARSANRKKAEEVGMACGQGK